MGKGWGDENNCEMCPTTDSGKHNFVAGQFLRPLQIKRLYGTQDIHNNILVYLQYDMMSFTY